jgi:hypothetical protein
MSVPGDQKLESYFSKIALRSRMELCYAGADAAAQSTASSTRCSRPTLSFLEQS